jgi:hypothetical protein
MKFIHFQRYFWSKFCKLDWDDLQKLTSAGIQRWGREVIILDYFEFNVENTIIAPIIPFLMYFAGLLDFTEKKQHFPNRIHIELILTFFNCYNWVWRFKFQTADT